MPSFYCTLAQFGQGLHVFLLGFMSVHMVLASLREICMVKDKQKFCVTIVHSYAVTHQFICLFD